MTTPARHQALRTRYGKNYDPYWMFQEARTARQFAHQVKRAEHNNQTGAWAAWQAFIDQWSVDSIEREFLVDAFGVELTQLDEAGQEYDPSMADIW